MKKNLLWQCLSALAAQCMDWTASCQKDFRYDFEVTAHFYRHPQGMILAPVHTMSHILHFHLLIDECSGLPLLPKLHSTVWHVEQSEILEPTRPALGTSVVSGHVQWQTEGLGKDGEKRMARVSVSCCCHMLGIPVRWQLSCWSLDGWKHAVFLLYDCAFEAMSLLTTHLRCIPVRFKHFIHSLTCSFH